MQEVYKFIIGLAILTLGIPIGNILAKKTKEELKPGRVWFKTLILLCGLIVIVALIIQNDELLFIALFIAIVTSRSLRR